MSSSPAYKNTRRFETNICSSEDKREVCSYAFHLALLTVARGGTTQLQGTMRPNFKSDLPVIDGKIEYKGGKLRSKDKGNVKQDILGPLNFPVG